MTADKSKMSEAKLQSFRLNRCVHLHQFVYISYSASACVSDRMTVKSENWTMLSYLHNASIIFSRPHFSPVTIIAERVEKDVVV